MENWHKICRLCLGRSSELQCIFTKHQNIYFPDFCVKYIEVEIHSNDSLPPKICQKCISAVTSIHESLEQFKENDENLRKILADSSQTGLVITPKVELVCGQNELDTLIKEPIFDNEDCENDTYGEPEASESDSASESSETEEEERKKVLKQKKKTRKKAVAKQPPGEKKKRVRKPLPDNFPRLNDNKCYVCIEKCGSKQLLLEHLSVHLDKLPFNCDKCVMEKVVIKTLSTLNVHLKMHAQPAKCEYCDKSYSNEKNKNLHINYYHLSKDEDKEKVECKLCKKICPSKKSYEIHMKAHNNEHQCQICQKAFGNKGRLKEHQLTHSDKRDFKCSTCGYKFKNLSAYTYHMKRHNNEKPYECQICNAKFILNIDLKNHMNVHEKNTEFKPNRDYKQYYTIKLDEETKERLYECNFCKKVKTHTLIRGHILVHLKPHKCTYCEKKFTSERIRIDHENTHTGAKPYVCEICGKGYTFISKLYKHNKLHVPRKHNCEHCDASFTYKANLVSHIKVQHRNRLIPANNM